MSAVRIANGPARQPTGVSPVALDVGFTYFSSLPAEIYSSRLIDFVEVTPETLCVEQRTSDGIAPMLIPEHVERARIACGEMPMVVHGVELSIGSAHNWNTAYLDILDQLRDQWAFRWHSEHLAFQTYEDVRGAEARLGTQLP